MWSLVHSAICSVEKRPILVSATLCLLAIDKRSSYLRSLNIADSSFMLIRKKTELLVHILSIIVVHLLFSYHLFQ